MDAFGHSQNDKGCHFIATNAYQRQLLQPPESIRPIFSASDIKHLSSLSLRALSWIAARHDVPPNANEQAIVNSIVSMANGPQLSLPRVSSANQSTDSQPQGNALSVNSPSATNSEAETNIRSRKRAYTEVELIAMAVTKLVEIIKQRNLKRVKTKQKMIEHILADQAVKFEEVECFKHQLEAAATPGNTLPHEYYRSTFNAVNLHSRLWYSLQHNHSIDSWRSKFTVSILEASIVNSNTIFRHYNKTSFNEFFHQLGIALYNEQLNLI